MLRIRRRASTALLGACAALTSCDAEVLSRPTKAPYCTSENGGTGGATGGSGSGGDGGAADIPEVAGIDDSKIVATLTDEEASAWCTWYVDAFPPGDQPPPEPQPPDPEFPGFAIGYQSFDCSNPGPMSVSGICIARPTVEECVVSLQRMPCNAPLLELNSCVLTMFACSDPSVAQQEQDQWVVGHGCSRLWDFPLCWHTVVQMPAQTTGCGIWLESGLPCVCN